MYTDADALTHTWNNYYCIDEAAIFLNKPWMKIIITHELAISNEPEWHLMLPHKSTKTLYKYSTLPKFNFNMMVFCRCWGNCTLNEEHSVGLKNVLIDVQKSFWNICAVPLALRFHLMLRCIDIRYTSISDRRTT